ncbi:hypothetical protein KY285_023509 [Solanum tuberosum]|nr:hypothetical protein KY289_023842 [Solanum tuberosum]KAH0675708.1 hypothetical protein KY285_023509 [Solanum tuberosum]
MPLLTATNPASGDPAKSARLQAFGHHAPISPSPLFQQLRRAAEHTSSSLYKASIMATKRTLRKQEKINLIFIN